MQTDVSPEQIEVFDNISRDISELYEKTRSQFSFGPPGMGNKSLMWAANHRKWLQTEKMLAGPILDGIQFVQDSGAVFVHHDRETVAAGICAEELVRDLEGAGFDLENAPPEIQESPFTNPKQIIHYRGRRVSVDFLYRLNICQRFSEVLKQNDIVVLEIGAGLGSLARTIRLFQPNVKYVIVDLLDTLTLSYSYLRANFPEASTFFVSDRDQLDQVDATPDYTFIPAELVPFIPGDGGHDIPRLNIDLAINTQSIGEMRQEIAEGYVNLIQNRLNVKRFYSLNRLLEGRNRHMVGGVTLRQSAEEEIASYCLPLDPYWDVLHWDYSPIFVGRYRYGDQENTLEFYGERTSPDSVDSDTLRRRSLELFEEAENLGDYRGHEWHRLMWNSIRLCPSKENVEPYYLFMKASNLRAYKYFGQLLANYGLEVEEPTPKSGLLNTVRTIVATKLGQMASLLARVAVLLARADRKIYPGSV